MNNKLFSEESEVPRTLFEVEKVAGSSTYKQSRKVWNCVVLWGEFVYSVYPVTKKEFDYLVLGIKKLVNDDLSLLRNFLPCVLTHLSFARVSYLHLELTVSSVCVCVVIQAHTYVFECASEYIFLFGFHMWEVMRKHLMYQ